MASKLVTKPDKKVEGSKPLRTETYTYSASSYRTKSYEGVMHGKFEIYRPKHVQICITVL